MVIWRPTPSQIIRHPPWRATSSFFIQAVMSAVLYRMRSRLDTDGMSQGLGDSMGWPKHCQLLLETLLRLLTADRGSRRAGCEGYCLGSPASLLAHFREKPTSSSILRRCIGMLILPAADMLGLPRRRRSRLGRK